MTDQNQEQTKPSWQPLSRAERRIVGVLVEKAKTTPNQYPLSLNALTNGCNQTSNRSPHMNLEQHQVEDAVVRLRALGAVGEVQGGSRVAKFRHYLKDWLGVTGAELAVMAELLLRGDQTIGELRGRANRMTNNEIPDVAGLRPVLQSLMSKGLVIPLTPAGRGQVVTHALYQEDELSKVKQKHGTTDDLVVGEGSDPPAAISPATEDETSSNVGKDAAALPAQPVATAAPAAADENSLAALRREIADLKSEVAGLKRDVEDLWSNFK